MRRMAAAEGYVRLSSPAGQTGQAGKPDVRHGLRLVVMAACLMGPWAGPALPAAEPLAVRVEPLTVPPSTRPLVFVSVKNLRAEPFEGTIVLRGPEGWRLQPPGQPAKLAPGQTQRIAFNVEQARNVAAHRYDFEVLVEGGGATRTHRQETFVASAPYFKPTIDGRGDDWQDAIPVAFAVGGKQTVVSTFWNRRQFSLLVAVQEDRLVPYGGAGQEAACDAVQFALRPLEPPEGDGVLAPAGRFEFLLVPLADGKARCFQLAAWDTPSATAARVRPLEALANDDAEVVVRRDGDTTFYECSLPWRPMSDLVRPSEGREFFFSVLVHDARGTGLRDLGLAAQLPPSESDAGDWAAWRTSPADEPKPLGNRIRWGLCTSKY